MTILAGHGKLLRALGARWTNCDIALGRALPMNPAGVSVLEREVGQPLLRRWNLTGERLP